MTTSKGENKPFIILILATFIAVAVVIFYIQHNSRDTKLPINGNQRFMNEYQVNAELNKVQTDIVEYQGNVRALVTTGSKSFEKNIDAEYRHIKLELADLQKINDDENTIQQIDLPDSLFNLKFTLGREVLDSFRLTAVTEAEKLIRKHENNSLRDGAARYLAAIS